MVVQGNTQHQRTITSYTNAEYFTLANDVAAIYALLPECMHIKELIWVGPLHRHEQISLLATYSEQSVQLRRTQRV